MGDEGSPNWALAEFTIPNSSMKAKPFGGFVFINNERVAVAVVDDACLKELSFPAELELLRGYSNGEAISSFER